MTLAMPHKYVAVFLEIPTSYRRRKKPTPFLSEKDKNTWQRVELRALNQESSTAQ